MKILTKISKVKGSQNKKEIPIAVTRLISMHTAESIGLSVLKYKKSFPIYFIQI